MDHEENRITETLERLEAAASAFERAIASLDKRQQALAGDLERISASIDTSEREQELSERLAAAEAELTTLRAAASAREEHTENNTHSLRRTLPPVTVELLAKQGIGDGSPVEIGALDAALSGLPVEQRIAVKAQLLRSGSLR